MKDLARRNLYIAVVISAAATILGTYAFVHKYFILYGINGAIVLICLGLALWNYKIIKRIGE